MRLLARLAAAAGLALLASACTHRIIDFTAISSKNVNIEGRRGRRVVGEDLAHIIVFFPTGRPTIKEAVDRALEEGGGDCLVDGVVYQRSWYIPLIYGQDAIIVEGTVVNTREREPARAPQPPAYAPTTYPPPGAQPPPHRHEEAPPPPAPGTGSKPDW